MQGSKFDPFGEPLPVRLNGLSDDRAGTGRSTVIDRLGIGVFWALVVGIVATRVAYFDPLYGQAMDLVGIVGDAIRSSVG